MSSTTRLARLAITTHPLCTSTSSSPVVHLLSHAHQQEQRRRYAIPVNLSSSVDALLGVSAPAAPVEGEGSRLITGNARPSNPNDLAEFLKPSSRSSTRTSSGGGGMGGALRRALGAIPTRNLELEGAFTPPEAPLAQSDIQSTPIASQSSVPHVVDRETPHPIDALRGCNDLDERVFAAAKALFHHTRSTTNNDQQVAAAATSLPVLLEQFQARTNVQLPIELPYESTPTHPRRVPLTGADSSEEQLALAKDDGVLLVAYVAGLDGPRGAERISICSGFAVSGGSELAATGAGNDGALVVSCAHTLRASLPVPARKGSTYTRRTPQGEASVALVFTRQGHIFPIASLLASQPRADLVLLQLAQTPLCPTVLPTDEAQLAPPPTSSNQLRTLPISPYPAVVGSELCVSSAFGWEDDSGAQLPPFHFVPSSSSSSAASSGSGVESSSVPSQASSSPSLRLATPMPSPEGREAQIVKRERDDAARSRWGRARLVEYKDAMGHEAKTGTYDDLSELDFKLITSAANPPALHASPPLPASSISTSTSERRRRGIANFPPPGSSGGPIVDVETGAVVGVTRGTKMGLLEGRRGDGIPAEKIFEFFTLPGMSKQKK